MGVLLGVLKIRRGLASHSVAVGVWVTQGSHTGEKHMIFRNPSLNGPRGEGELEEELLKERGSRRRRRGALG